MAQASTQQQIAAMSDQLASVDEKKLSLSSDGRLARLWSDVKSVEDAAETLRKEVIEPELEGRMSPGDTLNGISFIQSHRKYVDEPAPSVIGRAVARGIDYTAFVSLEATTLASDYPGLAAIGRNEYTYFRR